MQTSGTTSRSSGPVGPRSFSASVLLISIQIDPDTKALQLMLRNSALEVQSYENKLDEIDLP